MMVWLVGMMGSGKSTAGRLAANRLGVEFHDTDAVVAQRMGCSVAQLWAELGEATFRDLETVALGELASAEGFKSTGGGVVLDARNRSLLKSASKVVWLRASPRTLAKRLEEHSDRPLLAGPQQDHPQLLAKILEERTPLYEDVATDQIDTDPLDTSSVSALLEQIWLS